MNIKFLNKKEGNISFIIEGISETIANSLRRSVQEVPILAIDTVEFVKNDSALYDEILAHRLGLLPIKSEKLSLQDDCTCKGKGCSKCSISFKLYKKGPCIVYASDLKGKAEIIYKKTPIVILSEDQELEFSATARLGKAKEHTKFSPGLVFYRLVCAININKSCDSCGDCVKACPLNILEMKDNKIAISHIEDCDICEACLEACNKKEKHALEIKSSSEDFIFFIESWGQLSAKEIFTEAIKILNDNLKDFEKKLEKT